MRGGIQAGWKPAFQDGQDGRPPTPGPKRRMTQLAGPVGVGDSCGRYDRDGFRRSCFRRTGFKRVGCVSSKLGFISPARSAPREALHGSRRFSGNKPRLTPIWKTATNAPRCG